MSDSFATPWIVFPVHGILQARILEWVAMGSSQLRYRTLASHVGRILTCASNLSSLYLLPSSKVTSKILGICYSSTSFSDTKIYISQGSLGKQNQQVYKIRISTFILDIFLNYLLLIHLFAL